MAGVGGNVLGPRTGANQWSVRFTEHSARPQVACQLCRASLEVPLNHVCPWKWHVWQATRHGGLGREVHGGGAGLGALSPPDPQAFVLARGHDSSALTEGNHLFPTAGHTEQYQSPPAVTSSPVLTFVSTGTCLCSGANRPPPLKHELCLGFRVTGQKIKSELMCTLGLIFTNRALHVGPGKS